MAVLVSWMQLAPNRASSNLSSTGLGEGEENVTGVRPGRTSLVRGLLWLSFVMSAPSVRLSSLTNP